MKIVILDKNVRRNIEMFRQLVHRQGQKKKELLQSIEKGYKAYINRKTGELRFAELQKGQYPAEEWEAIIIKLHPDKEGAFEVTGAHGENSFDLSHFEAIARALLIHTFRTLNELAYHPRHARDAFWIMRQIAAIDFVLSDQEEGERNLVHDAWYNVDRLGAEKLLSGKQFGTYLFRKDEFAKDLEDSINEASASPVTCITLTYTDKDQKICEKTLVYKAGKWLFYDDDPTLTGSGYETVKELLDNKARMLQEPLYTPLD